MLLERVGDLSVKMAQYNQIKAAAQEANHFQTRATQLAEVAAKLEKARELLGTLRAAGVPVKPLTGNGATLQERASTLRAAVQNDPHSIADPPFNLKYDFIDRLLAFAKTADTMMLQAWRDYIVAQEEGYSEEILSALTAIPQFRSIVTRIRRCQAEIQALGSAIPINPQTSVSKLRALNADQRAAWSEMTADGIPVPVIGFLKACADEGAPLSSLTDEVRNWLVQRKLLSAFRIRL